MLVVLALLWVRDAEVALGAPVDAPPPASYRATPPLTAGQQGADDGDAPPHVLVVFWEVWEIVHAEFLDRPALDSQRLVHGAIRGMVESLEDPSSPLADGFPSRSAPDAQRLTYGAIRGMLRTLGDADTRLRTPEESRAEAAGWSGELEGIGACIEARGGPVRVDAPIAESPAARAGLVSGDLILAVDGRPVEGLPLREVVARIRGPRDTEVTLTIRRAEATAPVDVTLVRAQIRLLSARGTLLEPGIGLLRVTAFTGGTDEEVGAALEYLRREGARALVLDLRGNPGGWLEPAIAVASRFVPDGPIVWKEDGRGERQPYDRRADQPLLEWPLVVLVDRGTASAAEVVAAAVRDADRARLAGQPTYGKGTVQYVHELSDSSWLFVTAARWISPAGTRLDQGGLTPDVPEDASGIDAADAVLEQAVQLLRQGFPPDPTWPAGSLSPPQERCTPNSTGVA
ncbi:MAG: S41 family peptidase [Chloroflexi bacterium]|nr:S41 family peptidase [Chloroflexota bacterium]